MPVKTLTLLIVGLLLLCANISPAAELRTIGDAQFDIQPLIDWMAHHKGDRPLKSWKLLQVLEQKGQTAYPVLFCDIEGHKTDLLLKNCPSQVLALLDQRKPLEAKVEATKEGVQIASGSLARASNRREAAAAKRQVAAAKELQRAANKEMADLDRKIRQQQKVYAMNTGTTLGGLQVWDTGLRQ